MVWLDLLPAGWLRRWIHFPRPSLRTGEADMAAALRRATKTFPAEFTGASGSKRLELPAVVRHMLNIQVILVLSPDRFFLLLLFYFCSPVSSWWCDFTELPGILLVVFYPPVLLPTQRWLDWRLEIIQTRVGLNQHSGLLMHKSSHKL